MATTVSSSLSSLPDAGVQQEAPSAELGKDEFLRLLTTQMQYQDPLSPMDSQAFVAQLAQFSSVEQLQALSGKLDTLLLAQASANQMNTAALVGKEVLFRADRIGLAAGTPSKFEVTLSGASDETAAIIADASGRVVRTLQLGPRAAGTSAVSWDGLDEAGVPLPSGEYVLTVAGTRKDGAEVQADASVRGAVTGVTFEGGVAELIVAGRRVKLSDVLQVTTPTSAGA
jgi:flagellar basal-body rod modification protein FlgD